VPSELLDLPNEEPPKKSNGWSDSESNPGSNQKINVDDINYMPRPLAVRGKFVLDVEHGGGRRRRQKHLSRQQMFQDNPDKIGYDSIQDFQSRFVGQSPDRLRS
jgi:rhodanese-related sulfurtransferase